MLVIPDIFYWKTLDAPFFKINFFKKKKFRNTIRVSNCLPFWIQIRNDVLIWVQTVCKGYQQMTEVAQLTVCLPMSSAGKVCK